MRLLPLLFLVTACASTQSTDEPSFLFVQNADRAVLQNGRLTLYGVGENVVYFSDRPNRLAGHLDTNKLLQAWDAGPGSFAGSPPNAVFSIVHPEGVHESVVVLRKPRRTGNDIVYEVDVLEGPKAAKGGPAAVFIDNLAPWPEVRHGMHDMPGVRKRTDMHVNR